MPRRVPVAGAHLGAFPSCQLHPDIRPPARWPGRGGSCTELGGVMGVEAPTASRIESLNL